MILLQRINYFLCTSDAKDDGACDLSGYCGSEEVVPGVTLGNPVLARNGCIWYPANVTSQAGRQSEKQFLFRNHIN